MLSKFCQSLKSVSGKLNVTEIKSIVLVSSFNRKFSIEQIGKRHEQPFDYKNKQYGLYGQIFDSTLKRLGENSLIISVEGNFGAGKSEFAKKLAKEIDFVYAREPDLDAHLYQLPNGHNSKDIINEIVGDNKRFRIDSLEDWHKEPSFKKAIAIQHSFYNIRWMQYRTALLHLMSTGQGVVLERSVFSDSVISQAFYENNLLSDQAWKFYLRDVVPNTIGELWKPHVVIYLDKSADECLKTVREKGKDFEKNSRVYSLDLLKAVEKNYKKNFLPSIRSELHLLNYNTKEVDTERVIEDLTLLDFEDLTKFSDWRIRKETTINTYRRMLSDYDHCLSLLLAPSSYVDVPEYLWYGEELAKLNERLEEDPRYFTLTKASLFTPVGSKTAHKEWL